MKLLIEQEMNCVTGGSSAFFSPEFYYPRIPDMVHDPMPRISFPYKIKPISKESHTASAWEHQ